ncbi:MAG: hypothetical protein K0S74_1353 [Chlamydiales bacterium]|jgi:HEAT repeat protein|nr:hypothetical protein [Chlamydiales bacterium]
MGLYTQKIKHSILLLVVHLGLVGCHSKAPLSLVSPKEIRAQIESNTLPELGSNLSEQEIEKNNIEKQILYLIQSKEATRAIEIYLDYKKRTGELHLPLLQELALAEFKVDLKQQKLEQQLSLLYGASLVKNTELLPLLSKALSSYHPIIQLVAVDALGQIDDDRAEQLLNQAASSVYLSTVFEAIYQLAYKKSPYALGQLNALSYKLEGIERSFLPALFALEGSPEAIQVLRQFLNEPNSEIVLESIIAAGDYQHDELVEDVIRAAQNFSIAHQEASALTLAKFKDKKAVPILESLTMSSELTVRLAARYALYQLGQYSQKGSLEEEAIKSENLFAIFLLGKIEGTGEVLKIFLENAKLSVRVNAAMALLEQRDPSCLNVLLNDILLKDERDLAFKAQYSLGKGLTAWKEVPSAQINLKKNPALAEASLKMREAILQTSAHLPEDSFTKICVALFEKHQNDLIPTLIDTIESLNSTSSINLLRHYQHKIGAPFIRQYCLLALFCLNEIKEHRNLLLEWVKQQQSERLVRFRPIITSKDEKSYTSTEITPEEGSRLLIETFEALADQQNEEGIETLLRAIAYGHKNNRPILAGLLLHAIQ